MSNYLTITIEDGVRLDTDKETRLGLKYDGGLMGIRSGGATRSYDLSVPATDHNRAIMLYDEMPEMDGWRQLRGAELRCGGVGYTGLLYLKRYASRRFELLFVINASGTNTRFDEYISRIFMPPDTITVNKGDEMATGVPPDFGFYAYQNQSQSGTPTVDAPPHTYPTTNMRYLIEGAATRLGYAVNWHTSGSVYEDAGNYGIILDSMHVYGWSTFPTVIGTPYSGFSVTAAQLQALGLDYATHYFYRGLFHQAVAVHCFQATQPVFVRIPDTHGNYVVGGVGLTLLAGQNETFEMQMQTGDYFCVANADTDAIQWIGGSFRWRDGGLTGITYPFELDIADVSTSPSIPGYGAVIELRDLMPGVTLRQLLDAYCLLACASWYISGSDIEIYTFGQMLSTASLYRELDGERITGLQSLVRYIDGYGKSNIVCCDPQPTEVEFQNGMPRFLRNYRGNNDYLSDEQTLGVVPFYDGIWFEDNGMRYAGFDDVSTASDTGELQYSPRLGIFFANLDGSYNGYAKHISSIDSEGGVGSDFAELIAQGTTASLDVAASLEWFAGIKPNSVMRWHGRDWIVKQAAWGDNIVNLDLVRLPVDTAAPAPPPPTPLYQDLEYIESTGTQYIDTGYKPNNNSECEYVAMQIGAINYLQSQTFFGCSDGNWDNNSFVASTYRNGSFGWDGSYNNGWQRWSCSLNTMYTIKLNKTGAYIDNVLKFSTVGYTKTQNTNTLTLFAANYNSVTQFGKHRCYGCVIRENGADVMNLVPKLRTADSKPGLYDTVNDVFYTNQGTGEFLYA